MGNRASGSRVWEAGRVVAARSRAYTAAMQASEMPQSNVPRGRVVVDVRDLRKVYDSFGHRVKALDGVTLSVEAGRFSAIMGASGSGKSTLLHVVGGLTRPTRGEVWVEQNNLGAMSDRARTVFRRRRIGIIFQEYNLLPTLTAAENVALPWLLDGRTARETRLRVGELLKLVHLEERADHRPDALSGGEQQRVAIARALLNDPAVVLADEPTGNLDSRQSAEVWKLLRQIADEGGKTILMVTHEAAGAAHADEVIVLKDGQAVGRLEPKGSADASLVATGYQELAG
jgi:putative ABC transport system ATP-binding protein